MLKEYGTPDEDQTAYQLLLDFTKGKEVVYILHNSRVPAGARMCQLPGSIKVQAVMADKSIITSFQPSPGRKARLL